jgi:ribose transport system permease protein
MASDKALTAQGFGKFLARRDALAIILVAALWFMATLSAGLIIGGTCPIPSPFFSTLPVALLTIGLTYVIACGDIDSRSARFLHWRAVPPPIA